MVGLSGRGWQAVQYFQAALSVHDKGSLKTGWRN